MEASSPFGCRRVTEVIDVSEGFTSIEVAPDGVPYVDMDGYVSPTPRECSANRRNPTGARVTIAFSTRARLPQNTDIRVYFDIAENGGLREILCRPNLTHTTGRQNESASYHYRLSHWIPAPSVMKFVQT